MYKIILSDKTVLDKLTLNGNNYVSDVLIKDEVFDGNLEVVEIYEGKSKQVYNNMKLVANQIYEGKSYFILAEKTEQEKEKEKLEKQLDDLWNENQVLKSRLEKVEATDVIKTEYSKLEPIIKETMK